MKRKKKICMWIVPVVILVCTITAYAATEQWRFDGWERILQVVADGSGGCALFRIETNGVAASVVWLDRDGQVKYEKENFLEIPGPIISCTKKELIFSTTGTSTSTLSVVILQVDKKGVEKETSDPAYFLTSVGYDQEPMNSVKDKKGFFAVALTTNELRRISLVRYTYK